MIPKTTFKKFSGLLLLFLLAFFTMPITIFGQVPPITYPKVTAYVGIIHPLMTFNNEGASPNFKGHYVVGMPTGINLWKSEKIGFTFAGRAAFETAGRYGFTPVLSKGIIRNKNSSFFAALPLPVRFGNDHPASATIGIQLGLAF